MKRPDGVTVLSIFHFVIAAMLVLGLLIVLAILALALFDGSSDAVLPVALLAILSIPVFLLAAANAVAGWALLKMLEWGRWLAITLSVLLLPGFPLGTAIGGVALWYLMQPEVQDAFRGRSSVEEQ